MAENKLMLTGKVKGSTILEVVVAMVVIILVFGLAMMIYSNVNRSSLSIKKIKAEAILQDLVIKAQQTKDNSKQTIVVDDFSIEQEVKPSLLGDGLAEVHCVVFDANQQKIAELFKVISR